MKKFLTTILLSIVLISAGSAQFKLPKYEVVTLDNGLTIYLMEKKDVPIISFSANCQLYKKPN